MRSSEPKLRSLYDTVYSAIFTKLSQKAASCAALKMTAKNDFECAAIHSYASAVAV
jgi:hypothetical protein